MTRTNEAETKRRYLVRLGSPNDGSRIHVNDCPHVKQAKNPLRWDWAEGRPASDWAGHSWLHPCKDCRPDLFVWPQAEAMWPRESA